jgi:hypothetical protein
MLVKPFQGPGPVPAYADDVLVIIYTEGVICNVNVFCYCIAPSKLCSFVVNILCT